MGKTAIIIVSYNTPWHLNECLKSIFKHTSNFHIILVHNSQDKDSYNVVRKFEEKYPGYLTVIYNKKNKGLVGGVNSAYNLGIKFKRVCFLNSDIIVTKNWLEELNKVLDENSNVLQVSPDLNHYYRENLFWRLIKWQILRRFPRIGSRIYKYMLYTNPPKNPGGKTEYASSKVFYQYCTGACNLVRTEPFIKRGYFWDPNIIHGYGDDFDTSYYLRQFGEIGVINKSYVFHFLNISFNKLSKQKSLLKNNLKKYNLYYVFNKWRERLQEDLSLYSPAEIVELADNSPEIKAIIDYFGMVEVNSDFKKFISTIPAKKLGEDLGIFVD